MADVNINKFRASVVRDGSKPASPGFIVSEGQDPVDPAGNGQNHLPVTIATAATGLSITDSQVLGGAGNVGQYIRGDGSLADFPQASGGGSSVSYYLNGSVAQGTIGGVAYKELNKVPILGAGTDFTINANGYIASFLTDAGDPNLLEIPGGNWNFETYFSASSSGGSPSFYVELYKYNGTTFTLIASSSSSPELIAFGTNLNPYFSTLAVPTTTLALTDRLAIRYYVNHSGRTITLHTENNHLCQVVTTFTTGLTSLNGLTAQVQNLAVGTSGTDFNIASATATHTFNLPTASATNRGALSSADWTTFNNKQNALGYVPVPETRTITINGVSQDLSANRTYNVGTVTSVGLSSATSGVTIGGSPVTGVGAFTLAIATASGSQNGLLSSTDWTTFNGKQNALTNPVTGTGSAGQIAYFSGTSAITSESGLTWDATNNNLSIGGVTANSNLTVSGSDNTNIFTVLSGLNSRLHIGTVTSPNNDVYIRSQNNYNLKLGTNNTNYLTIFNSGNVFIGTSETDNGARLQVSGTATILGPTATIGNAVAATNVKLIFNGVASKAAGIEFQQSGTPQWYIGNGIASEDNNFELYNSNGTMAMKIIKSTNAINFIGAATFSGTLRATEITASMPSGNGALYINNSSLTSKNWTFIPSTNAGETDLLLFYTGAAAGTRLTVTNSGNVGIGTSSPSTKLNLYNATTQTQLIITGGDTSNQRLEVTDGTVTNRFGIFGRTNGDAGVLGTMTNHPLMFIINNSERMRITSVGNLGIGTTNATGQSADNRVIQIYGAGVGNRAQIHFVNSDSGESTTDGSFIGIDFSRELYIINRESAATVFENNGSESMRITSGRNVLIGTQTDSGAKFRVFGTGVSANIYSDNNTYCLGLGYQGTLHGYLGGISSALYGLSANGGQVLLNSSSVWVPVSDVKRKRNFENYDLGLNAILGLKPKYYHMDFQKDSEQKQVGLVAQEVKEFIPQAFEQNDNFIGLNYNAIIVTMVKAIQDQQKIINDLKQKIQ